MKRMTFGLVALTLLCGCATPQMKSTPFYSGSPSAYAGEAKNRINSVDSFPFFTYDSKANGYSKTSLCWRLFRNEYDPETDARAIDFLFVSVWRQR